MRLWLLTLLVVAAAILAPLHDARKPAQASCMGEANCAACHEGRVPRTHGPEFVRVTHGPAANADRTACLGCHQADTCDECHLETAPEWHTEAFKKPELGPKEREEHARIGIERRDNCRECHTQRFQKQCAKCHTPEEWSK